MKLQKEIRTFEDFEVSQEEFLQGLLTLFDDEDLEYLAAKRLNISEAQYGLEQEICIYFTTPNGEAFNAEVEKLYDENNHYMGVSTIIYKGSSNVIPVDGSQVLFQVESRGNTLDVHAYELEEVLQYAATLCWGDE